MSIRMKRNPFCDQGYEDFCTETGGVDTGPNCAVNACVTVTATVTPVPLMPLGPITIPSLTSRLLGPTPSGPTISANPGPPSLPPTPAPPPSPPDSNPPPGHAAQNPTYGAYMSCMASQLLGSPDSVTALVAAAVGATAGKHLLNTAGVVTAETAGLASGLFGMVVAEQTVASAAQQCSQQTGYVSLGIQIFGASQ